jgi:hypothetical protein
MVIQCWPGLGRNRPTGAVIGNFHQAFTRLTLTSAAFNSIVRPCQSGGG